MPDEMNVRSETIEEFLSKPSRYRVPIYQRLYAWEAQQHQEFWDDLQRQMIRSQNNSDSAHFLGTILLSQTPSVENNLSEYYVVDGQQRLTTVTLLLAAIKWLLSSNAIFKNDLDETSQKLFTSAVSRLNKTLLTNKDELLTTDSDYWYKLHLIEEDFIVYKALLTEVTTPTQPFTLPVLSLVSTTSKVLDAFNFFVRALTDTLTLDVNKPITARQIEKISTITNTVLKHLKFISSELSKSDDVNQIFESLNNRGIPLTEEDLIKNYIMMTAPSQTVADSLYKTYWRQYETISWWREKRKGAKQSGATTNFGFFLYNYLAQVTSPSSVPELQYLVRDFKKYVEDCLNKKVDEDKETILTELLKDIYEQSQKFKTFSLLLHDQGEEARRAPKRLSNNPKNWYQIRLEEFIERTVPIEPSIWPLILWITNQRKTFGDTPIIKTLTLIEAWLIRREISRSKNTKQGIFSLLKELKSQTKPDIFVNNWLKTATAEIATTPDDARIHDALENYSNRITTKLAYIILFTYEDELKKRNAQRVARISHQIEHIIPKAWKEKDYPLNGVPLETREYNIHKLGNLTLLHDQVNAKIANKNYTKKSKKYLKQDLAITKELAEKYKTWSDSEIQVRTAYMADYICSRWPKIS